MSIYNISYSNLKNANKEFIEDTLHKNNIISFEDIPKYTNQKKIKCSSIANKDMINFSHTFEKGILRLIEKEYVKDNHDIIKQCFEISCNILYDRKILKEVVEKQKKYEIEYVVDFFRYVLRIFLNRYNSNTILTKNQCKDIKELCTIILEHNNCYGEFEKIVSKISAKDIIESIKTLSV